MEGKKEDVEYWIEQFNGLRKTITIDKWTFGNHAAAQGLSPKTLEPATCTKGSTFPRMGRSWQNTCHLEYVQRMLEWQLKAKAVVFCSGKALATMKKRTQLLSRCFMSIRDIPKTMKDFSKTVFLLFGECTKTSDPDCAFSSSDGSPHKINARKNFFSHLSRTCFQRGMLWIRIIKSKINQI